VQLVLSRKGLDAGWGGRPSPILPGGVLVPVPIPEARPDDAGVPYRDLPSPAGSVAALLGSLGVTHLRYPAAAYRRERGPAVRVAVRRARAHLDPDLVEASRARGPGWRPAFGQVGSAQTHLAGRGVGPGDLFLFFGWFRDTAASGGRLRFRGDDQHVLWGWLEVRSVVPVDAATRLRWAHPHLDGRHLERYARGNTLYLAAERLSLDPRLPGAGVLDRATPPRRLTRAGASRRVWDLPACLHPDHTRRPLTYHGPHRWERHGDRAVLDTVRGQEFVVDVTPPILAWVADVLAG
jgi:hypothetical protein